MAIKPFAIQGADLTLGGVNLQAGTTGVVIPGVTQAANYFVEEVDENGSGNNQDLGSDAGAITVIDNAEYVYRSGGAQSSGTYAAATYSVDELDSGNIEAINVETDGVFEAADKTRAEAANMWATLTPTPFVSFNTNNWIQIPFRPKMRAGAIENVGGGAGVDGLTGNTDFNPEGENDTRYELNINNDIKLRIYQTGTEPNDLGPGFSLGRNSGSNVGSGVVAIGNIDTGYDSKRGGVYIGYEAGWNNEEDPQGEYAIAIGARAARNFAQDNSITLNATGVNLDPTADGLYIKPVREVVENTAKALYYNTLTGEVSYADPTGGGGSSVDPNVWVQTFVSSTPLVDFPQIATSVEYDSDGNVIGLFSHFDDNNGATYFSVGKYTPAGTKIWTARLSDDIQTDGWGLAVDSVDGWIYVAGQSDGTGANVTYPYDQATLTKIDPVNGSVEWHRVYDFGYASASAVVDVDSDGNPIMVGYVDVGGNSNESYLAVTKINKAVGTVLWSRKLDGQADEEALGMAVGPNDEVVAVGYMSQLGLGSTNAVATVVTVPSSNVNWTTQYGSGDGTNENYQGIIFDIIVTNGVPAITIKTDPVGNRTIGDTIMTLPGDSFGGVNGVDDMIVNVASVSAVGDTDDRIVVVKYLSDGTIDWQRAIQFDSGFDCTGADADIDSQGNIYICGQYEVVMGNTGIALIKFNSAGVKQWSRRVTGNCFSTATSIVVGPDDKLYISGVNGDDVALKFIWVVAKYSLDGLVEWQRFMENTTTWTFAGQFFNNLAGGSNIAVRQDYVALAGGFGNLAGSEQAYATLVQVPATGDVFTVGNWDFRAANLSGVLNSSASDITVIDAGLTDSDNAGAIEGGPVVIATEVTNFLIGTLFTAPGSSNELVNGDYSVTLETTGTLTLPAGGTITEGYVTSNPTIQLTPASPDVASQKLVIKGGANPSFTTTQNGITVIVPSGTWTQGNVDYVYVEAPTRGGQTLYWWIYPEGAGLTVPSSGTVTLDEFGDGTFTFTLVSDDYEFTVRVSPEDNNYGPVTGVESILINSNAPTFASPYHLHLTTGDLTETSIFLGTDNHNVRTNTDGGIEITTPNTANNVWTFGTDGSITFPTKTTIDYDNRTGYTTGPTLQLADNGTDATVIITGPAATVDNPVAKRLVIQGQPGWREWPEGNQPTGAEGGDVYIWAGYGGEGDSYTGNGGDVKLRAGTGGQGGGYIRLEAGEAKDSPGAGGFLDLNAGHATQQSGGIGGPVEIRGGKGTANGGAVNIHTATTTSFNNQWTFANDGSLTLPKASSVSEFTPATGAAANVIVVQSASSIANVSFVSLPPAPILNYTIPGTDIVVDVNWNANGNDYHAPRFTVVDGGTGHTGGGESGGGDVLTVPYADMGISGGGNWTWYVADIASNLVLVAGNNSWVFDGEGGTTFPNGSVQTTAWTGARITVDNTTASLADTATGNLTITGYKGYVLYKIQTSHAAWVRIYTDTASRSADSGRSELTDPAPGAGVIAEVITTGAETVLISPGTIGFSNESTPSSNIQLAVTNKSGTTTTIMVTLTVLQLEV
jgi:hypothetical protein